MDRIELEESSGLVPVADVRPRMDEPPPVRLVCIDDVRLVTLPGRDAELDRFYVGLLEFVRESQDGGRSTGRRIFGCGLTPSMVNGRLSAMASARLALKCGRCAMPS